MEKLIPLLSKTATEMCYGDYAKSVGKKLLAYDKPTAPGYLVVTTDVLCGYKEEKWMPLAAVLNHYITESSFNKIQEEHVIKKLEEKRLERVKKEAEAIATKEAIDAKIAAIVEKSGDIPEEAPKKASKKSKKKGKQVVKEVVESAYDAPESFKEDLLEGSEFVDPNPA
jgi:hypothetical protein